MTEHEWLTSSDPVEMLEWLRGNNPLLPECPIPPPSERKLRLFACAVCRLEWDNVEPADLNMPTIADLLRDVFGNPHRPATLGEWRLCNRCRTTFRPSRKRFHRCPSCDSTRSFTHRDPPFLTPTVIALAQTIYDERSFDLLPVLADALEDGGCGDGDLLRHLRGEEERLEVVFSGGVGDEDMPPVCRWLPRRSPHVRGCWVVDLVLDPTTMAERVVT